MISAETAVLVIRRLLLRKLHTKINGYAHTKHGGNKEVTAVLIFCYINSILIYLLKKAHLIYGDILGF